MVRCLRGQVMARPTLRLHPKFRRLMYLLSLPEPYALGLLECLWEVAYASGDERIGDEVDVELASCWPGDKGAFCKAMIDCKFLDKLPDGSFAVHDLWDHAPDYVKARARRESARQAAGKSLSDVKREAANKRWNNANDMQTNASENHLHTSGCKSDANEATPSPSPTPALNTLPVAPAEKIVDKKPRTRDPLFDAIAEVSHFDPSLKNNASQIGKTAAALRAAKPPYTPEEVRGIPSVIEKAGLSIVLTPSAIEKYVCWVRDPPKPTIGKKFEPRYAAADNRTAAQKAADRAAEQKRIEADKEQAAGAAELLAKLRGIGRPVEENS